MAVGINFPPVSLIWKPNLNTFILTDNWANQIFVSLLSVIVESSSEMFLLAKSLFEGWLCVQYVSLFAQAC